MNAIKAVIFDLDDTLTDRAAAFDKFANALLDRYFGPGKLPQSRESMIGFMVESDGNGYADKLQSAQGYIERFGMDVTAEEIVGYWKKTFAGFTVPALSALDILKYLRPRYKLGIVTNGYTSAVQHEKIDVLGIRGWFDEIVVSCDLGYHKPDARIFAFICQRLDVHPSEALFVGDHFRNDIAGAKHAGLRAAWVKGVCHDIETDESLADWIICDIAQLKQIL